MILLFFGLILGYIGVAIWVGLGVGGWLTRDARQPMRVLVRAICVGVLLYLPVWDYIPGKMLFDRHCANKAGLQSGPAPFEDPNRATVLFEGEQLGACGDCIASVAVGAVAAAETYIDPPRKVVPMIPTEGYVRIWLVPRAERECRLLNDYFNRSRAYADKTDEERLTMFWGGRVPEDFSDGLDTHCVEWESIKQPTANFVLKQRTHGKDTFFWTYLYETHVELRRRTDDALVASYGAYQYHPWFNTNILEGPRLFIFRCPNPDNFGWWSLSFVPSRLFIEMMRHYRLTNRDTDATNVKSQRPPPRRVPHEDPHHGLGTS